MPFPSALNFVILQSFEHPPRLTREQVQISQGAFRRTTGPAKVRRQYPVNFAGRADERRRLHRADSGSRRHLASRSASEQFARPDVFNDHSRTAHQSRTTCRSRDVRLLPEEVEKLRAAAAVRHNTKNSLIDKLD